ncbi:MAG: rRNA pseudouridine synthase [Ahniella sp.]|nr:rRNA pseudouridine synthase [Ahniella sp.]
MTESVRLSKRLAEVVGCSRADAERYIEDGWVRVDGEVVDMPQFLVTTEKVELDKDAVLEAPQPATILLHKPVGFDSIEGDKPATSLVTAAYRWAEDSSGVRLLRRHFARLTPVVPLDDGRVWRRLTEDADIIEHEYVVEVDGELAPYGLARLNHGLTFRGRPIPPCKVSWQNEFRLRFAIKAVQPGQIRDMCAQVGLQVTALRRLRIGKVSLGKMPVGSWRYLPAGERF